MLIVDLLRRYETTKYYRDSGVADINCCIIKFETSFIRPDRFKFQWVNVDHDQPERNVLWRKGNEVYFKLDGERGEWKLPFERALAGACGASGTVASEIGGLLMPFVIPTRIRIASYEQEDVEETINGINCTLAASTDESGARVRLWVDSTGPLLLKTELTFGLSLSQAQRAITSTQHPELDGCTPSQFVSNHKTLISWNNIEFEPNIEELSEVLAHP